MSPLMYVVILFAAACGATGIAIVLDIRRHRAPTWHRPTPEQISKVCMDCKGHYGGPKPSNMTVISHGLCLACKQIRMEDMQREEAARHQAIFHTQH
jgi:hypothetical protein